VIADVNPDKFGALTPGTWIPIENEGQVLMSNPDYLLILPWHFRNFFVTNPLFKGRNLAFPLPRLEIVTPK
jgi:NDP-4-keto-2,6-dideoxyhexose 3-C-methyltransferase